MIWCRGAGRVNFPSRHRGLSLEGACRPLGSFLLSVRSVRRVLCRPSTALLSGGLKVLAFFDEVSQLEQNVSATLLTIHERRNLVEVCIGSHIPFGILSIIFPPGATVSALPLCAVTGTEPSSEMAHYGHND